MSSSGSPSRARCSIAAPACSRSYFKNPQATNDTKTEDGWVHTGDAGYLDDRGHLRIIDRAKDVGKLNDGTLFAPKFIENKLKFFPNIKEAVAFGPWSRFRRGVRQHRHRRPWATGPSGATCAYAGYTELAARKEVYDLVQSEIERVNRDLAADPRMAGAQIRRFLILHKALDADDGELTRTNKVRRGFIARALQRRWSTRSTATPARPTSRSTSLSRTAARARSRATSRSATWRPIPALASHCRSGRRS